MARLVNYAELLNLALLGTGGIATRAFAGDLGRAPR
jgi:hypothetical protein